MSASDGLAAALRPGGARLYAALTAAHDLTGVQEVLLLEAARTRDRCDQLDALIRGDPEAWASIGREVPPGGAIRVDGLLREARQQATVLKQLLAALRLPDPRNGRRAQRRPPRGVYRPRL